MASNSPEKKIEIGPSIYHLQMIPARKNESIESHFRRVLDESNIKSKRTISGDTLLEDLFGKVTAHSTGAIKISQTFLDHFGYGHQGWEYELGASMLKRNSGVSKETPTGKAHQIIIRFRKAYPMKE